MTEATVWPTFDAYRACLACDHGGPGEGCRRPEVQGRGQPVAFAAARRHGGACGPEAGLLTIKGFDYSKETTCA